MLRVQHPDDGHATGAADGRRRVASSGVVWLCADAVPGGSLQRKRSQLHVCQLVCEHSPSERYVGSRVLWLRRPAPPVSRSW